MTKDNFITKVVFRKWKPVMMLNCIGDGIIALFPEQLDNGYTIGSYEHYGQHSAADYDHVISCSRPATPDEYKNLYNELESLGYNLRVMKKCRPNFSKR